MTRQLRPSEKCLNCGVAVATRFCPECGQENTSYRVSLGRLLGDLVEELFQLESRLWRTLWLLFRRPGLLTCEYSAGRRVAYTTPLRLYLLASVAYFFVAGLAPHGSDAITIGSGDATELQQQIAHTPAGWQRNLLEHVARAQRDPKAMAAAARAALATWVPRLMAILVPLFALVTFAFFRRCQRYYVEHLVFALHLHAVAFLWLALGESARDHFGGAVAFFAVVAWSFFGARRVFGDSWWRLAWKLPLVGMLYAIALGIGISGVFLVGGGLLPI